MSATNAKADITGSTRKRLGQILLDQGQVAETHLDQALSLQQQHEGRLGAILTEQGFVEQGALRAALVEQAAIETLDLEQVTVDPEALNVISAELAFNHKVLPFAVHNHTLSVAMADPFDRDALEAVRALSGKRIKRFYCAEHPLIDTVRRLYGSNVARMIADLDASGEQVEPSAANEQQLTTQLQELAREPTVVNLVNLTILEAIDARASDIHFEPFEKTLKVKYRVDGILHERDNPPKKLQPAIISRVKIMAGMNIAERFVPQDGHIAFHTPRGKIDIRVATVPTLFGECVVMRLLDRSTGLIDMEQLGLNPQCRALFAQQLERPHGIILVTGPTGSGKTTTLYGALNRIYTPEKKIITIEDPVEYELEGVNQIPVNPKRGIDFANGLRAILRQDPDIIMVGEIRDRDTAEIAIRSALTGHLVFSTLHTNDAPGAVTRLLDMGVEPFLLASSLECVLAQRLVRTICPDCKTTYTPAVEAVERLGRRLSNTEGTAFAHGEGCHRCRQTGFLGRAGIFELLRVTDPVRQAIAARSSAAVIASEAPADHEPMVADGYRKAVAAVTTIEEVLRVTQDTRTDNEHSPRP